MNGHSCNYEPKKNRVDHSLELAANSLYNKVVQRGLLSSLKRLFGREEAPSLITLDEVKRQINVHGHEAVGQKSINLDMVLGTASDGRARDFDIDFRPLQAQQQGALVGCSRCVDERSPIGTGDVGAGKRYLLC